MSDGKRLSPRSGLWRAAVLALTLLAVWLYLSLFADTSLLYHLQRRTAWFPAPPCHRVFSSEFLAQPGGPVDYAYSYLSQLYFYPAVGAAILTAVAGLLALASAGYLSRTLKREPRVLHLVPALLVALPFARYMNPLAPALAVLAATAAAWAYVALPRRWAPARIAGFAALAAACYWVAGGASLMLGALCVVHELLGRRWRAAAACFALSAATPLAGAWVAGIPVSLSYLRLLPADPAFDPAARALFAPLYLALPLTALGARLARVAFGAAAHEPAPETGARPPGPAWGGALGLVLLLGLWAPALVVLDDPRTRALGKMDRALDERDWESVIATAEGLDPAGFDRAVSWDVNRALCHAGRLSSEMLKFPQSPDRLIPLPVQLDPGYQKIRQRSVQRFVYLKCMDAMYDLGRLNEAELVAHEAWEMVGEHPRVIAMLAMINIAKRQPEAARAFLADIRCDPVYGAWSRRTLERLQTDPEMAGDPEVRRLRACRVTEDRNASMPLEGMLTQLLDSKPDNRVAYEYLMAYYLLTRQLGKFMVHVGRVPEMGYARLPVHFEEALLLYGSLAMKDVGVPGYEIRPATAERLTEFRTALEPYGDDRPAARRALAPRFGDTYEFYYFLGTEGTDR